VQERDDPLLHRGRGLLLRHEVALALPVLEQALAHQPTSGFHHAWYGWALFLTAETGGRARIEQALVHLETAELCPRRPAELPELLDHVRAALDGSPSAAIWRTAELDVNDEITLDVLDEDTVIPLGGD